MPWAGIALLLGCIVCNVVRGTGTLCTSSGSSRIKLLGVSDLPPSCMPPSDDYTGHAVFECLQSWKLHFSNCQVRLTPLLYNATSGLPCRFFTSTGNITGPHTAHVQAAVDTPSLLSFLQTNPDIAARLSGNPSAPASSQEVAENLALALKAFFTHHHSPHRRSHHHSHRHRHKHLSSTPATSNKPTSAQTTPTTPSAARLATLLRPQQPARRLLAAVASTNQHLPILPAAANSQPCIDSACNTTSMPSRINDLSDNDIGDTDNPADITRVGNRLMFASDSCVYVYKIKGDSDFLNGPDPSPAAAGGWMVVVACLSGAAMMGLSVAWFLAARGQAMHRTRLADALLLQQQEEQRRATAERMASLCTRPPPCSGSDVGSTTSSDAEAEAALLLPAATATAETVDGSLSLVVPPEGDAGVVQGDAAGGAGSAGAAGGA